MPGASTRHIQESLMKSNFIMETFMLSRSAVDSPIRRGATERDACHTASSLVAELTHAVTVGFTRNYDNERTPPDLLRGPRDCRHGDARQLLCVLPNVPLSSEHLAEFPPR